MKYCPECGTSLVPKMLKGEGEIPYCGKCAQFRFPVFSTAVSMIVQNPDKTKILRIQQYGRQDNILVAGYVSKGESAESAVRREVMEETGLELVSLEYNRSEYFPRSNTLMLNFACVAAGESLDGVNNEEVDLAQWFTRDEAREKIRPESLAKRFLLYFLDKK